MEVSDDFKKILKKGTFSNKFMAIIIVAVFGVATISTLVSFAFNDFKETFSFFVAISIVFSIAYWFNRHKFKGYKFWLDIFENKTEELIWIKPITTTHTVGFVIPVTESYQYELFLKDGTKLLLGCTPERRGIFEKGIATYAPHAHFGYSREIKKLYRKDKSKFLENAKEKGLFMSASEF